MRAAVRELLRRYITARELSEMTGMTIPALATMRCRGEGPKFYKSGRSVRYDLGVVEKWIVDQKREHLQ